MLLPLVRAIWLLKMINLICYYLFLMQLYIWGMFERGVQLIQPTDYDSRRARGEA